MAAGHRATVRKWHAHWVGFGDDAAARWSGRLRSSGQRAEVLRRRDRRSADGLHAALAVAESLRCGGGEVIEIALAAVAAEYAALPLTAGDCVARAAEPTAPALASRAGELGADNERVRDFVRERASGAC